MLITFQDGVGQAPDVPEGESVQHRCVYTEACLQKTFSLLHVGA